MIKIEGSYLEGGGQIVRTALALSTITQEPFEAWNIRKGRKDPGLKSQHLYCIKTLQELSNAEVEGDTLGSEYLKYTPKRFIAKDMNINIGTAGSIILLLQAILLPCLFANRAIKLKITGGTDTTWSPSFDYFRNVLAPQIQRFAKIEAKLLKRGYYPKGNGEIEVKINPDFKITDFKNPGEFLFNLKNKVHNIRLMEQHYLIKIDGISHASKNLQNAKVSERQAETALNTLKRKYSVPIRLTTEYQDTLSTGSGITLWAIFSKNKDDIDENNPVRLGSDNLGQIGKKAETVGEECANNLIKEIESKAPVDRHLADQILPYLALCSGSIKASDITSHCRTNIYTINQFLGSIFKIDEKEKIISCNL